MTDDETKDLIRQGERTVDNLKRLFAVVFALSFGVAANAIIAKLKIVILAPGLSPEVSVWLLNCEMFGVFLITAAVFYHQSVKFLDIRYAKTPFSAAHPWGFAADYLQLVLTAAPFFLMANSLTLDATQAVGFLWFFVSYVSLLAFGLVLLIGSEIRHSHFVRVRIFREDIAPEEIAREGVLRAYWMIMNSGILLILLVVFALSSCGRNCPARQHGSDLPWFLYVFGLVAFLRDFLDYRWAWPFLYPLSKTDILARTKWPLPHLSDAGVRTYVVMIGLVLVGLDVAAFIYLKFWDFHYWITVCR